MSEKKKKDSDLPETQPEGLSPEGDKAFQPDETTMVPFDQFHDVLLKLEAEKTRAAEAEVQRDRLVMELEQTKMELALVSGAATERVTELEAANTVLSERALKVKLKLVALEHRPVDPDQVETHHLNPSELPSWVLAKLPESLTVDTSKFQEPPVAYAIRFALGRGAKEGDIVHFCAGV